MALAELYKENLPTKYLYMPLSSSSIISSVRFSLLAILEPGNWALAANTCTLKNTPSISDANNSDKDFVEGKVSFSDSLKSGLGSISGFCSSTTVGWTNYCCCTCC